jgi:hypothetical protein
MLAAAAVAAVLSIGATANEAAAMPTMATQLGLVTSADSVANPALVQKAAIVCGYYGCRHVWWGGGPYWGHPYWGWHRRWGWRRW